MVHWQVIRLAHPPWLHRTAAVKHESTFAKQDKRADARTDGTHARAPRRVLPAKVLLVRSGSRRGRRAGRRFAGRAAVPVVVPVPHEEFLACFHVADGEEPAGRREVCVLCAPSVAAVEQRQGPFAVHVRGRAGPAPYAPRLAQYPRGPPGQRHNVRPVSPVTLWVCPQHAPAVVPEVGTFGNVMRCKHAHPRPRDRARLHKESWVDPFPVPPGRP
jgi:hypothetical protein